MISKAQSRKGAVDKLDSSKIKLLLYRNPVKKIKKTNYRLVGSICEQTIQL
jgi:hypothetical protein